MAQTKDADFPWWLVILGVTGLWMGYEVWASAIYSQVMGTLVKGIQVTVAVTLVAYVSACALGLALAQAGLAVTVIDARLAPARAEAGFDGRAYALAIASKRLLSVIGVWGRLADKVQPILQIKASDGLAGQGPAPFFLTFDHTELEEGPMGFLLEDRFLYSAFHRAMVETLGITLLSGESVIAQEVTATGVTVTLVSGRSLTGRLLAGCDGRASGTADRAGIRRIGWGYGPQAIIDVLNRVRGPFNLSTTQLDVAEAAVRVREGAPIARSLAHRKLFPPMLIHLKLDADVSTSRTTLTALRAAAVKAGR